MLWRPLAKRTWGAPVRSALELEAMAALARGPRSLAEAEAGTYRKVHLRLHGMEIAIETPRGRERIGWAKDGSVKWRAVMPAHYGYVKGTRGHDGDQVDVYLMPEAADPARPVFVVEQVKLPSRAFDEVKCVIGAEDEAQALKVYDAGFSDGSGPQRRRAVRRYSLEDFKDWLRGQTPALAKVVRSWREARRLYAPMLRAIRAVEGGARDAMVETPRFGAVRFGRGQHQVGKPGGWGLVHIQRRRAEEGATPRELRRTVREIARTLADPSDLPNGTPRAPFQVRRGEHRVALTNVLRGHDGTEWRSVKTAYFGKPPPRLSKAAPTDPPDDAGAWGRPTPDDDTPAGSSAPAPIPYEDRIGRALAALFRSWLRDPREIANQEAIAEALRPVQDAFKAGADAAAVPPGGGSAAETAGGPGRGNTLLVSFDARNRRVEEHLREYSLGLVREITDQARQSIRGALTAAAISGAPVEQQARWIRESIGLTDAQAGWVRSFRWQLENGDQRALLRALRDRRFDPTIRRALESGQPIPPEKIDAMVDAYHRRTLAYRAMTIARTEGIRAANMGGLASVQSMLEQHPELTVEKTWLATRDERTRHTHQQLNGQTVEGLDAPFVVTDEQGRQITIRYPHDPLAPASETVNCRCTLQWRVKPRQRVQLVAEAA